MRVSGITKGEMLDFSNKQLFLRFEEQTKLEVKGLMMLSKAQMTSIVPKYFHNKDREYHTRITT